MTLQWTVIAFILYAEIGTVFILLLPWIRPTIWKKFFNSRFIQNINRFSRVYFYAVVAVLLLLFFDAAREVRKYAFAEPTHESHHRVADVDSVIHMRLFRAQRNLYISGFTLLLFLVINRIVRLLYRSAHLEAAAEAAMKQAESASKTAKTLMETGSDGSYEKEKKELLKKLQKAEADRDTMKKQAEGLQEEYDKICTRLIKLETKEGDSNKKMD